MANPASSKTARNKIGDGESGRLFIALDRALRRLLAHPSVFRFYRVIPRDGIDAGR